MAGTHSWVQGVRRKSSTRRGNHGHLYEVLGSWVLSQELCPATAGFWAGSCVLRLWRGSSPLTPCGPAVTVVDLCLVVELRRLLGIQHERLQSCVGQHGAVSAVSFCLLVRPLQGVELKWRLTARIGVPVGLSVFDTHFCSEGLQWKTRVTVPL